MNLHTYTRFYLRRSQLWYLISPFRCSSQVPPGVSGELVALHGGERRGRPVRWLVLGDSCLVAECGGFPSRGLAPAGRPSRRRLLRPTRCTGCAALRSGSAEGLLAAVLGPPPPFAPGFPAVLRCLAGCSWRFPFGLGKKKIRTNTPPMRTSLRGCFPSKAERVWRNVG